MLFFLYISSDYQGSKVLIRRWLIYRDEVVVNIAKQSYGICEPINVSAYYLSELSSQ